MSMRCKSCGEMCHMMLHGSTKGLLSSKALCEVYSNVERVICRRKTLIKTSRENTWVSTNSWHGCVRIRGVFSVTGWKTSPVHGPAGVTGGETSHSQLSHRAGKENHIELSCHFILASLSLSDTYVWLYLYIYGCFSKFSGYIKSTLTFSYFIYLLWQYP